MVNNAVHKHNYIPPHLSLGGGGTPDLFTLYSNHRVVYVSPESPCLCERIYTWIFFWMTSVPCIDFWWRLPCVSMLGRLFLKFLGHISPQFFFTSGPSHFISGATPAEFLTASMRADPFKIHVLYMWIKAWVGLELRIECVVQCPLLPKNFTLVACKSHLS